MMTDDRQPPRIVETASATTDPDNEKSGSFAYVVAGAAVVLSLAVGIGLRGCVSVASEVFKDVYGTTSSSPTSPLGAPDDDYDWLDDEGQNDGGGIGGDSMDDTGHNSGSIYTVEDLVGEDLAMFNHTIDSRLSASAYANAQQEVSSYVRELVVTDRNASSDMATSLHNAAWGEDDLSQAIDEAKGKADATIETIRAMKLPQASGDHASEIGEDLEKARDNAIERWESIKEELEVLAGAESLTWEDIDDLEKDVTDTTDKAAEHLAAALKSSAER